VLLLAGNPALAAGEITGPVLVMLLFFATAVFEAVVPLSTALQLMPAARAAVGRIGELSEASPPVPEPVRPALLPTATDLVFRNVICSYGDGVPVLNGFNLVVPQGSCVALTGPSGCGKSTLMEILLRFRPYCGSVTVGGKEICDLAGDDLRRLIAVLPQRPHLFNASVRENIMLGKRHATPEELAGVLEDTALSPWLGTLPRGVDTEVGEGGSAVSGGEARRIALARALLKDVPLLLLDEPTEGLDASTERDVVARLAGRIAGRTVLLVTHRPACLSLADRVVRFDDCLGG
jgi:ATP-binding cassette subfamily C protein CydC